MNGLKEEILQLAREEMEEKLGLKAKKYIPREEKLIMKNHFTICDFPKPFIVDGKLDALFVFGATRRYEKEMVENAVERAAVDDVLGSLALVQTLMRYNPEGTIEGWLDTWDKEELENHNLIVIGSPRVNLVARELNENDNFWFRYIIPLNPTLASHYGGRPVLDPIMRTIYQWTEPHRLGVICFGKSPYNKEKYALLLFGHGVPGTLAAIKCVAKYTEDLKKRPFGGVVKGKVDWSRGVKIVDVEWLTRPYSIEEYLEGILWARSVYAKYREEYPKFKTE